MGGMMKYALVAITVFALAGCAPATAQTASNAEHDTTRVAESTATSAEIASVVAGYEAGWRETAAEQSACRMIWTLDSPDDPISGMKGATCYLQEQTSNTNAELALRELEGLTPPSELEALATRTEAALAGVVDVDLIAKCGEGNWPAADSACTAALGSNSFAFSILNGLLDEWAPFV